MVDITTAALGLAFSIITIAVFVAMGFYAFKNLKGFKGGLLSRGWKFISIAVFFFIGGQFFLDAGAGQAISGLQSVAQYNIVFGSLMETIGGFLLVMGFRAQNNIWKLEKVAPKLVSSASKST
jgi:hypothetical protein